MFPQSCISTSTSTSAFSGDSMNYKELGRDRTGVSTTPSKRCMRCSGSILKKRLNDSPVRHKNKSQEKIHIRGLKNEDHENEKKGVRFPLTVRSVPCSSILTEIRSKTVLAVGNTFSYIFPSSYKIQTTSAEISSTNLSEKKEKPTLNTHQQKNMEIIIETFRREALDTDDEKFDELFENLKRELDIIFECKGTETLLVVKSNGVNNRNNQIEQKINDSIVFPTSHANIYAECGNKKDLKDLMNEISVIFERKSCHCHWENNCFKSFDVCEGTGEVGNRCEKLPTCLETFKCGNHQYHQISDETENLIAIMETGYEKQISEIDLAKIEFENLESQLMDFYNKINGALDIIAYKCQNQKQQTYDANNDVDKIPIKTEKFTEEGNDNFEGDSSQLKEFYNRINTTSYRDIYWNQKEENIFKKTDNKNDEKVEEVSKESHFSYVNGKRREESQGDHVLRGGKEKNKIEPNDFYDMMNNTVDAITSESRDENEKKKNNENEVRGDNILGIEWEQSRNQIEKNKIYQEYKMDVYPCIEVCNHTEGEKILLEKDEGEDCRMKFCGRKNNVQLEEVTDVLEIKAIEERVSSLDRKYNIYIEGNHFTDLAQQLKSSVEDHTCDFSNVVSPYNLAKKEDDSLVILCECHDHKNEENLTKIEKVPFHPMELRNLIVTNENLLEHLPSCSIPLVNLSKSSPVDSFFSAGCPDSVPEGISFIKQVPLLYDKDNELIRRFTSFLGEKNPTNQEYVITNSNKNELSPNSEKESVVHPEEKIKSSSMNECRDGSKNSEFKETSKRVSDEIVQTFEDTKNLHDLFCIEQSSIIQPDNHKISRIHCSKSHSNEDVERFKVRIKLNDDRYFVKEQASDKLNDSKRTMSMEKSQEPIESFADFKVSYETTKDTIFNQPKVITDGSNIKIFIPLGSKTSSTEKTVLRGKTE